MTEEELKIALTDPNNIPSEDSLKELFGAFNTAQENFLKSNPKALPNFLMPTILQIMLSYPYSWMQHSKQEHNFLEAITLEAKNFLARVEFSKKQKENVSLNDNSTFPGGEIKWTP